MDSDQMAELKRSLKAEGYNIYVYSYPDGMIFPMHSHEYETIHVVLSGSMKVTMADTDHILSPGMRFLVPPGVAHSAEVLGSSPVVCLDATRPAR
ncbi:MAG: cupin domain-containing protein [Ignavibacteria bacterium]|nr:cupin domain-containing protein [Ignavibacteria bacterium]